MPEAMEWLLTWLSPYSLIEYKIICGNMTTSVQKATFR